MLLLLQDVPGGGDGAAAGGEGAEVDVEYLRGIEGGPPQVERDLVAARLKLDQLERPSDLCCGESAPVIVISNVAQSVLVGTSPVVNLSLFVGQMAPSDNSIWANLCCSDDGGGGGLSSS